jgi:hypothetical protein
MAINEFKKIIDTKGYKLDAKDREIFERDMQKTLFGSSNTSWNIFGNSDMIEFVLYDSNENKLPQGDNGDFVRYIHLDDANINKYFQIKPSDSSISGVVEISPEFLVDTELLIKEAGYSNGIFKTQITLLNRRAGSEKIQYDRMWIHEIAPSRTEIRVLPVNDRNNDVLPDLQERYDIFTSGGQFRDDTIVYVQQFVESINIENVFNSMSLSKGRFRDGQTYINLIKDEFKIDEFKTFLLKIKELLIQSMQYYVENRDWDINSLTYGMPLSSIPPLSLSKEEICKITSRVLADTIDYLLPRRNVLENSTLSMEDQITFDELQDIYNTQTSDSIYESTLPESTLGPVMGCTDPNALNFNPSATRDDGSCIYETTPTPTTQTWYVWSADGKFAYIDVNGETQIWYGSEYDSITVTYIGDIFAIRGDIRTYPKPQDNTPVLTCGDPRALNYGEIGICRYLIDPTIIPPPNDDILITNGEYIPVNNTIAIKNTLTDTNN